MYMKKIAVGYAAKGAIDISKTPKENMINVAKALNKEISELIVIVQDRDRHKYIIDDAREIGARVKLFGEGDVAAVLACGFEDTGVDLMIGTGGAPEGVIAAAAIKCMNGEMQAVLVPQNEEEIERCSQMGITNVNAILTIDDLVKSDDVYFAATAITDCDLLKGVTFVKNDNAQTHTIVMRAKTGTIRFVDATHNLKRSSLTI